MSATTRTLLVTGFEPFDGATINPSQEIAGALDGRTIAGHRVVGVVLPCVFGAATDVLRRRIRELRPRATICLGFADNRAKITPERVAINVDDARIPDNAGAQPVDRPIARGGPAAYFSTLPVRAIVEALQARSIPAAVSNTAGTFVCNRVFYDLMRMLTRRRGVRGGFIHVPRSTEMAAGAAGLPLATLIEGIAVAAEVVLTARRARRPGRIRR